ncbi:unnamed protein product [Amoebophrya sp. A25]|nr:unnamed protein product [Amoebophrya sp. A25]|eukprot:GSA25T00021184001.1
MSFTRILSYGIRICVAVVHLAAPAWADPSSPVARGLAERPDHSTELYYERLLASTSEDEELQYSPDIRFPPRPVGLGFRDGVGVSSEHVATRTGVVADSVGSRGDDHCEDYDREQRESEVEGHAKDEADEGVGDEGVGGASGEGEQEHADQLASKLLGGDASDSPERIPQRKDRRKVVWGHLKAFRCRVYHFLHRNWQKNRLAVAQKHHNIVEHRGKEPPDHETTTQLQQQDQGATNGEGAVEPGTSQRQQQLQEEDKKHQSSCSEKHRVLWIVGPLAGDRAPVSFEREFAVAKNFIKWMREPCLPYWHFVTYSYREVLPRWAELHLSKDNILDLSDYGARHQARMKMNHAAQVFNTNETTSSNKSYSTGVKIKAARPRRYYNDPLQNHFGNVTTSEISAFLRKHVTLLWSPGRKMFTHFLQFIGPELVKDFDFVWSVQEDVQLDTNVHTLLRFARQNELSMSQPAMYDCYHAFCIPWSEAQRDMQKTKQDFDRRKVSALAMGEMEEEQLWKKTRLAKLLASRLREILSDMLSRKPPRLAGEALKPDDLEKAKASLTTWLQDSDTLNALHDHLSQPLPSTVVDAEGYSGSTVLGVAAAQRLAYTEEEEDNALRHASSTTGGKGDRGSNVALTDSTMSTISQSEVGRLATSQQTIRRVIKQKRHNSQEIANKGKVAGRLIRFMTSQTLLFRPEAWLCYWEVQQESVAMDPVQGTYVGSRYAQVYCNAKRLWRYRKILEAVRWKMTRLEARRRRSSGQHVVGGGQQEENRDRARAPGSDGSGEGTRRTAASSLQGEQESETSTSRSLEEVRREQDLSESLVRKWFPDLDRAIGPLRFDEQERAPDGLLFWPPFKLGIVDVWPAVHHGGHEEKILCKESKECAHHKGDNNLARQLVSRWSLEYGIDLFVPNAKPGVSWSDHTSKIYGDIFDFGDNLEENESSLQGHAEGLLEEQAGNAKDQTRGPVEEQEGKAEDKTTSPFFDSRQHYTDPRGPAFDLLPEYRDFTWNY